MAIIWLCVASGCTSPMFTLKNEDTGGVYGPYTFANGQYLKIGSELLVLKREPPPDHLVEDRMKASLIQEVDFRNAHVKDIVEFLRTPMEYSDPTGRWVNPPVEIVLVIPEGTLEGIPLVTLQADMLSLYATVKTVAKLTGLRFTIHDSVAWLEFRE